MSLIITLHDDLLTSQNNIIIGSSLPSNGMTSNTLIYSTMAELCVCDVQLVLIHTVIIIIVYNTGVVPPLPCDRGSPLSHTTQLYTATN